MTLSYNIVCDALVRDEQKPIVRSFARSQYSRKREAFNAFCLFRSFGQGVG